MHGRRVKQEGDSGELRLGFAEVFHDLHSKLHCKRLLEPFGSCLGRIEFQLPRFGRLVQHGFEAREDQLLRFSSFHRAQRSSRHDDWQSDPPDQRQQRCAFHERQQQRHLGKEDRLWRGAVRKRQVCERVRKLDVAQLHVFISDVDVPGRQSLCRLLQGRRIVGQPQRFRSAYAY